MSKPHLAILGAGPTGLDAALAAVDGGFPFTLYEASPRPAGHIRSWGHVRLFSPWSLNVSPRMLSHLAGAGLPLPPDDGACPTGAELVRDVLAPVASLPSVAPHLRTGTAVRAVSRAGLLKNEEIGTGRRADRPFRLLLTDGGGREWVETADRVLDCTGTWGRPNPIGDGGIPAPGEAALDDRIVRRIPDIEHEAAAWAGRTTLLVGSGHSAQTAARDLADLAARRPGTRVLWALRRPDAGWPVDPDDPLPERSALAARARELAEGASAAVEALFGVAIDALAPADDGRVAVTLRLAGGGRREVRVDRVLGLTGSVGDDRLYRQLQVHECYATSGPMKLAAALLAGGAGADCLAQDSHGAETLVHPEPGFFILGAKSYGRTATFLMRVGWQQVDEVFGLLG